MAKVNLESCIKTAKEIAEDHEYKVKAARNPKNKRLAQTSFDFWASVADHLENYQKTIDSNDANKQPICKDHNNCCFIADEGPGVFCKPSKGCFQK